LITLIGVGNERSEDPHLGEVRVVVKLSLRQVDIEISLFLFDG
jgi:hypothetical protein